MQNYTPQFRFTFSHRYRSRSHPPTTLYTPVSRTKAIQTVGTAFKEYSIHTPAIFYRATYITHGKMVRTMWRTGAYFSHVIPPKHTQTHTSWPITLALPSSVLYRYATACTSCRCRIHVTSHNLRSSPNTTIHRGPLTRVTNWTFRGVRLYGPCHCFILLVLWFI